MSIHNCCAQVYSILGVLASHKHYLIHPHYLFFALLYFMGRGKRGGRDKNSRGIRADCVLEGDTIGLANKLTEQPVGQVRVTGNAT